MRRTCALLAAIALAVAGCGNSGSKSSAGGLNEALSFIPKGAPVVFAVQTDPNGSQWKQVNKLLARLPFSGQIKQGLLNGLQKQGLDYSADLKPLLGNEAVISIPSVAAANTPNSPAIVALKVKDTAKANSLLARRGSKAGTIAGAQVYHSPNHNFAAVKDGVLVSADTQALLQQAIQRHGGGDSSHMTKSDFDRLASGANESGLVVVGVDVQQLVAGSPKSAAARQIKWVGALRTAGGDLTAQSNGLAIHFDVKTAPGLSASDLPLASGGASPKLVRRPAEVGFGIRDLAQTIAFIETASRLTNPTGYARFKSEERQANAQLGIDIEKDVFGQATGDSAISIGLDKSYAVRAVPRDPAALRATLAKAAPKFPKLKNSGVKSVARGPAGLYVATGTAGQKVYFGMVGGTFVAASDPARAQQVAEQSASSVQGASGAFALALDMRSLANAAIDKQGGPPAAKLFTSSLGDLTGSVRSETSGLTGSFQISLR